APATPAAPAVPTSPTPPVSSVSLSGGREPPEFAVSRIWPAQGAHAPRSEGLSSFLILLFLAGQVLGDDLFRVLVEGVAAAAATDVIGHALVHDGTRAQA